ncbi:MAG: glycoside hydrolase family 76 protein [Gordonia sp. (in: high G+C Gram-positive bacteria)]
MASDVESPDLRLAQDRAAAALDALRARHLRRLGHIVPGTRIGVPAWPPVGRFGSKQRITGSWNYWWQAHLVDVLVDAAVHRGDLRAARDAVRLIRGIRIRNVGRWTNDYYDDMAWLALATERVDRLLSGAVWTRHRRGLRILTSTLYDAWAPEHGGGIPWRTTDHFFNVPANGPAAIFLARRDRAERAIAMADWIHDELLLPSGLLADGFWPEPGGGRREVNNTYTYCQGVGLGAYLEAYRADRDGRHVERIDALLTAVAERMCTDGVINAAGGGDGGLFAGILARYLALVATDLPADAPDAGRIRSKAAEIVLTSADSAWNTRAEVDGLPLFGPDWRTAATVPTADAPGARFVGGAVASSATPERDLSVQLSGALLLEAAVAVTTRSSEHTG